MSETPMKFVEGTDRDAATRAIEAIMADELDLARLTAGYAR